ncbi:hypothetical protein K469DRAFT_743654 [Zopfia rhizophila CBS 207.26]|uniref:RBR-type E3 ubiquitin transferase n=1 Tax=Zopfia rhizophila CBS 207.26 TaxID=1314779 RepID=A0A6A6ES20_9PEZI|nr:hypothetical protein K469DRAFT_743654 [Zopfia rhizophila CBS 207.26]
MGSRISKAVRQPHEADRSVAASSSQHHGKGPCQDKPLLPLITTEPSFRVDALMTAATSAHEQQPPVSDNDEAMDTQPQPLSWGAQSQAQLSNSISATGWPATSVPSDQHGHDGLGASVQQSQAPEPAPEVSQNQPLPTPPRVLPPPPPAEPLAPLPPPAPPVDPKISCITCCEEFSTDKEHSAILRPCRNCESTYCSQCVKDMFIKACREPSRMPPRCCNMLQLHVAIPYLTKAEAAEYRQKYEEWSTPNPFYCPVPSCSVFISPRLLPSTETSKKGKQRVDSVVGTPQPPVVACPECRTDICVKCRQLSHTTTVCNELAFGDDNETAALLKSWGYKRCPKCGNGVRRMLGCNHMQCLCGAAWCWVCQQPMDECGGNCYEDEDEDDEVNDDDEDEPETQNTDAPVVAVSDAGIAETIGEPSTQPEVESPPVAPTPSQPVLRPRNLDAGSPSYWESQGLDFGNEPAEDAPDRTWQCYHDFHTAKVSFEESIRNASTATGMECSRCWSHVHPEINLPGKVKAPGTKMVAGVGRERGHGHRGRWLGRAGRARGQLMRGDAAIGVAFSQSFGGVGEPMEGVEPTGNGTEESRVIDTYGRSITMADSSTVRPRRSSFSGLANVQPWTSINQPSELYSSSVPHDSHSRNYLSINLDGVADNMASTSPFSFAHECRWCGMLVCDTCRDTLLTAQKKSEELDEEVKG